LECRWIDTLDLEGEEDRSPAAAAAADVEDVVVDSFDFVWRDTSLASF
jgi:hypothetical protein